MSRIIVGPFNRVEGDLEVQLEMTDNRVHSAWIKPTLFRGFETMLLGRNPSDVLVYAPRICGICSVSQSVAAAKALSQIYGLTPTENGQKLLRHLFSITIGSRGQSTVTNLRPDANRKWSKAINLMLANENVADLLTHFYLFFMPDFARKTYRDAPWFHRMEERFKSVSGTATRRAIELVPTG